MLTRAPSDRVGTCDACAEGDKPLPYEDGDAWICRDCNDRIERSLDVAGQALVERGYFAGLTKLGQEQTCRTVALVAVRAYLDAQFDGNECP